jgi:hypothetical protein
MTNKIEITSFQGGLSNDRNIGQKGAFWNSRNIEYRQNSAYIELNKWYTTSFSISGWIPTAITLWWAQSSILTDILVFTNNGKVYNSVSQQGTVTGSSVVNTIEANGKKYMIGQNKLEEFVALNNYVTRSTFTNVTEFRPAINFYGDIIIGDGTQVLRYNKDTTLIEYATPFTAPVIGWLAWIVYAITQVGANIYVWCNDWVNTIQYIWDWVSAKPSQKLTYTDTPVRNVALLWNQHYWWASKSDYSIKQVLIWESYQPQTYIKSAYPAFPLSSNQDSDDNRMAITTAFDQSLNAIETLWDIVYLPGEWSIYGFGKYFPGQKYSFSRDFSFTGTKVTAMVAGWKTGSGRDAGWFLVYSALNWSSYDINVINMGQKWETPWVRFASSGYIETMEYIAPNFAEWENSIKITFPFELPHASTSINVYVKYDRWSYVLIKNLTTTEYGVWYKYAEIADTGKWKTKQINFELITSNTTYSPKLYTQITNIQQEVWKR